MGVVMEETSPNNMGRIQRSRENFLSAQNYQIAVSGPGATSPTHAQYKGKKVRRLKKRDIEGNNPEENNYKNEEIVSFNTSSSSEGELSDAIF